MSAIFIMEYSGWPMQFPAAKLVPEAQATRFSSEAEGWFAAQCSGLNPDHFRCRSLTWDSTSAPQ